MVRCSKYTASGRRCKLKTRPNNTTCHIHTASFKEQLPPKLKRTTNILIHIPKSVKLIPRHEKTIRIFDIHVAKAPKDIEDYFNLYLKIMKLFYDFNAPTLFPIFKKLTISQKDRVTKEILKYFQDTDVSNTGRYTFESVGMCVFMHLGKTDHERKIIDMFSSDQKFENLRESVKLISSCF